MLRSFQDSHRDSFVVDGGSILLTDDEYRQEFSISKHVVAGLEVRGHGMIEDISICIMVPRLTGIVVDVTNESAPIMFSLSTNT